MSKTRVRLQEEILAGCWESLQSGRADLLVCPKLEVLPHDVKAETIGRMSMTWVAAPTHYVHKRVGDFDDLAREKYRIIAIADTAREQPAITVNIVQRQPRLTVTNLQAKVDALVAGLGIGTLPTDVAQTLIEKGQLKAIGGALPQHLDVILAWKRNQMGEAKSWCIQYIKKNWKLK